MVLVWVRFINENCGDISLSVSPAEISTSVGPFSTDMFGANTAVTCFGDVFAPFTNSTIAGMPC